MNIEALLHQVDQLLGDIVDVSGYLCVVPDANTYRITIAESHADGDSALQIRLDHTLPEFKKIITPLSTQQLIYRGTLTNPPYHYRFPVTLSARLTQDDDNQPMLTHIHNLRCQFPHIGKTSTHTYGDHYTYQAQISYEHAQDPISQRDVYAVITIQRLLRFTDNGILPQTLDDDANLYARRMIGQQITIPGWLHYRADTNAHNHHYILETSALRARVIDIGPLTNPNSIWWPPCPQYALIRSHTHLHSRDDLRVRANITGVVDYLDRATMLEAMRPALVFTQVDAIRLFDTGYLLR